MDRRDFLRYSSYAAVASALPGRISAQESPIPWRTFKITYQVDLPDEGTPAQLWLPVPETQSPYQQAMGGVWRGTPEHAEFREEPVYHTSVYHAQWQKPGARHAEVITHVRTMDRHVDLSRYKGQTSARLPLDVAKYLKPTEHMPRDGIVLTTTAEIIRGAKNPLEKAKAIYDWVVENTYRDPKIEGCGRGDIKFMLESGNFGGKCTDINALFVGLARAAGLPAREKFGIRVAESSQFKSLGKSGEITKAQHCRAEFYLAGLGWIPVDPADVRKAVLEEKLPLDDPKIIALREKLFGAWEMNWVAFNHGRDFSMTPLKGTRALNFFMYPHAEIAGVPRESLDAPRFKYRIEAAELI